MIQPDKARHAEKHQIARFCLYGFLKNLQFFEPFLILAFREKGFSFTQIGFLISFRAICVNVLEVPSGAAADAWGKRRAMILSMLAYIASFVLFAVARQYWAFFPAMLCFSIGEAFRTGTHKAMIFNWLSRHGMESEKTRIYGLTRSWSKQGSSLNCIAAAAIVVYSRNYEWIFMLTSVPYALNILNLMLYPAYLDGEKRNARTNPSGISILKSGIWSVFTRRHLTMLIAENVCFEGVFSVVKDYLQPLLRTTALTLPLLALSTDRTRTAVLVAAVYFVLHQASSIASRNSHRAVVRAGSERRLGAVLWIISAALYAAMFLGFKMEAAGAPIASFALLFVLLNIWKPVLVSRFHEHAEKETAATTLSIANQSKTLAIAVISPLLGHMVDSLYSSHSMLEALWPVAAAGALASLIGLALNRAKSNT